MVQTRWVRTPGLVDDIVNHKAYWSAFFNDTEAQVLNEISECKVDLYLNTIFTDAFASTYNKVTNQQESNKLENFMRNNKRDTLIIFGSWTEACVQSTAHTASQKQIHPIVLKSCTAGHPLVNRYAFALIDSLFGDVVNKVTFDGCFCETGHFK